MRFAPLARARFSRVFRKRDQGIVGIEIGFREDVLRLAPTRMLAANLNFRRTLEQFLKARNASREEFDADGRLRAISARQFLLSAGDAVQATELFRGTTLVAATPSGDEDRAAGLAEGIGRWMLRNLSVEGRLPYKYWPSRGAESSADNAIRRFLASLALARLGELRGSAEIRARKMSSSSTCCC